MSIKPIPPVRMLAWFMAAAGLVACANLPGNPDHAQHHAEAPADTRAPAPSGASSAQGGMMGGASTGSQAGCPMMGDNKAAGPGCMPHRDKEARCAMYRGMRDAPNDEARRAMMDRHMQAMSPEMRQQHMEMMRRQCQ